MAITYHNSASNPADNGTNTTTPIVVTPPASMAAGDLVFFLAYTKIVTATFAISQASGQTWNTIDAGPDGVGIFWCRFNGTWGSDPSIAVTGGAQAWSAVMHVFRPTTGTNVWAVDQALVETDHGTPSSPFTVTITGQTTTQANTVTIATWASIDDNTWGSLSGAGWVTTGSAQYRNTSGNDISLTFAHKIQTSAGATGNVSKNQATLGGDQTVSKIITFYESAAAATVLKDVIMQGGVVPRAR